MMPSSRAACLDIKATGLELVPRHAITKYSSLPNPRRTYQIVAAPHIIVIYPIPLHREETLDRKG
ncbi:hypothetical protein SAMN05192579_11848 [Rhodanobacter glycinis]|uniref:Uncharacterized protein n=1 Tax=Rhodanobacter glycinis TaxID=582702 RepID=A0A1I4FPQ4_9GAMM|nr:hypothetical protein SAMN05192579_11848 [Rhodanobacter glycinis]